MRELAGSTQVSGLSSLGYGVIKQREGSRCGEGKGQCIIRIQI